MWQEKSIVKVLFLFHHLPYAFGCSSKKFSLKRKAACVCGDVSEFIILFTLCENGKY